ncbi:expression library immunization antigen 1 [Trichoderma cornu-damae]|uniref:Expression library immunization antigen 1 n=1 Tax=Trichoderma cornu-damae TaxID=654480 RepID=A0A9P8QKT0_9HYPO|nr:expression library immunization antigen 1 [Trichoderma cornu-damae]
MRSSAVLPAILSLASLSSAHFLMNYPKSIGFDDSTEGNAPCGGFTPDLSSGSSQLVDFHVGGDSLAMRSTHTQVNWLFRVTLDAEAASGWQQIFPIVMQSGLGNFCEPLITLPSSYAGKKGIISVVSDAPDGLLYQCVSANFVSGSVNPPSACTNASVTASFVSDSKLSALVSGSSPSSTSSASGTSSIPSSSGGSSSSTPSSTQSSAAAATTSHSAAPALRAAWSASGFGLGSALTVLSMVLAGGALMA